MRLTNAMNEWGFIGQEIFVSSDSYRKENPPQLINLNKRVATSPLRSFGGARCARREVSAF